MDEKNPPQRQYAILLAFIKITLAFLKIHQVSKGIFLELNLLLRKN